MVRTAHSSAGGTQAAVSAGTHSAVRRQVRIAYQVDLNEREPAHLAWVVDLIERFVLTHRGGCRAEVDASLLGARYRPRSRGDQEGRTPRPALMSDADLLGLSRAWGTLPRTPWPYGQILRCSYLPGYPRPEVACRLMHIAPGSWVRERNEGLLLLAAILRRDAAWLVPAEAAL